jgi:hypothetical protein
MQKNAGSISNAIAMKSLHDLISKKQWFILFNVGSLAALLLTGRLK